MKSLDKIYEILVRFRGLTSIGIANLASNAIAGLFWLYLAALIGTENYGIVSYFLAISGITTTITFLGAGNTIMVYAAKGVKIQPALYLVTIVGSSIASLVLYFMFHNIGVSLFVLGNIIFGLGTYELLGRRSYKKYAIYIISQKLLMVVLSIGLNYVMGSDGVILGISLSFFPASILTYQGFKIGKIDFPLLKSHLGFILNSYALDLTRVFSGTLDKIIIAPIIGFALLGNYSLGVQFLNMLQILPSVVFSYILPHDAVGKPNTQLKRLMIIFSGILAAVGVFLSPIFIPVLFPKFTEAITVIQIMSLGIVSVTVNFTYISKFLGQEKSRIVLIGSAVFLSVQIPLIVLLTKPFGINGAAISYVLASASEAMYFISVDRYFQRKDNNTIKNSSP